MLWKLIFTDKIVLSTAETVRELQIALDRIEHDMATKAGKVRNLYHHHHILLYVPCYLGSAGHVFLFHPCCLPTCCHSLFDIAQYVTRW